MGKNPHEGSQRRGDSTVGKETAQHTRRLPSRLVQGVRCEETYRAPVPELGVPEPGVPGSVTLGPVPGLLLIPEPLLPAPGVPEPLIPEPLLPEPEVWASTNGAVTRSTARAVTTV